MEVTGLGKINLSLFSFIDIKNVILDVLHMDLRVTDRLELLLRKDMESLDSTFSNNLAENTNLKKYSDFLESFGIKKPSRIENKQIVLRDLNGNEKRKMLEKIFLQDMFPRLNRVREKDNLWKTFQSVMTEAKNTNVHKVNIIKEKTLDWYRFFRSFTFQSDINPYIHIFGMHLHEKIA